MADQWLSWRLDVIASFLILIVALLSISQRDHINPSLTAVSLTEVPALRHTPWLSCLTLTGACSCMRAEQDGG